MILVRLPLSPLMSYYILRVCLTSRKFVRNCVVLSAGLQDRIHSNTLLSQRIFLLDVGGRNPYLQQDCSGVW